MPLSALPPAQLPASTQAPVAEANFVWETLLKASSRQRVSKSSGMKVRDLLADAELFLTLCNRPRDRWGYFVLSWLGREEIEKVCRSHTADKIVDYSAFRDGLICFTVDSSSMARIALYSAAFDSMALSRSLLKLNAQLISALKLTLSSRRSTSSISLWITLSLEWMTARLAVTYSGSANAKHSTCSKLCALKKKRSSAPLGICVGKAAVLNLNTSAVVHENACAGYTLAALLRVIVRSLSRTLRAVNSLPPAIRIPENSSALPPPPKEFECSSQSQQTPAVLADFRRGSY